jgi:hypothetical protein
MVHLWRRWRAVAVIFAAVGLTLFTSGVAQAYTIYGPPVCGFTSNPECLNAWNGGPYVKTYTTPASHEDFVVETINGRCVSGSPYTTNNCPISGTPAGLLIVQVTYGGNQCVGDLNGEPGDAVASAFDGCNSTTTGYGGAYGTVFILYAGSCPGNDQALISSHWSSSFGNFYGLAWSGPNRNGAQIYLNVQPVTCLGDAP